MDMHALYVQAQQAAAASYSPYSHFRVGAALLCDDGAVFSAANVENRSFGLTTCAERNAVGAAVAAGRRRFVAIAIATPDAQEGPVGPCGACRQVVSEFMAPEGVVWFGRDETALVKTTMGALMPLDSLHDLAARLE